MRILADATQQRLPFSECLILIPLAKACGLAGRVLHGHSRWIELAWLSIAASLLAIVIRRFAAAPERKSPRPLSAALCQDLGRRALNPSFAGKFGIPCGRACTQAPAVVFFRLRGISATNSSPPCDCITIVALAEMHAFKGT